MSCLHPWMTQTHSFWAERGHGSQETEQAWGWTCEKGHVTCMTKERMRHQRGKPRARIKRKTTMCFDCLHKTESVRRFNKENSLLCGIARLHVLSVRITQCRCCSISYRMLYLIKRDEDKWCVREMWWNSGNIHIPHVRLHNLFHFQFWAAVLFGHCSLCFQIAISVVCRTACTDVLFTKERCAAEIQTTRRFAMFRLSKRPWNASFSVHLDDFSCVFVYFSFCASAVLVGTDVWVYSSVSLHARTLLLAPLLQYSCVLFVGDNRRRGNKADVAPHA